MKKKLPVHYPPVSDCYSADAGIASILQAYDLNNPDLFLNRLYLYKKSNGILKFATLDKMHDIESIEKVNGSFLDYLINSIDSERYIFLYLDHYYIKQSSSYKKIHFAHDFTLIYGYDTIEQCFFCADNFENGKYVCLKVSFDNIVEARSSLENLKITKNNLNIILLNYNYRKMQALDLSVIKMIMSDFVYGSLDYVTQLNPTFLTDNIFGFSHGQKNDIDGCVFGIRVYEWLIDECNKAIVNNIKIDIRPFQLIINHQNILLMLMQSILGVDCVNYKSIQKKQIQESLILRNLIIKYNITKLNDLGLKIEGRIKKIYTTEKALLNNLVSNGTTQDITGN